MLFTQIPPAMQFRKTFPCFFNIGLSLVMPCVTHLSATPRQVPVQLFCKKRFKILFWNHCHISKGHQFRQYKWNQSVKSTFGHDDVIKWKLFPRCWPFVRGIHRSPVNSLICSLICAWINGWGNNCKISELRRYRAHYDVTIMGTRVITYSMRSCTAHVRQWLGILDKLSNDTDTYTWPLFTEITPSYLCRDSHQKTFRPSQV